MITGYGAFGVETKQNQTHICLSVCYYHVTYAVRSEFPSYSLSECEGTPYSKEAVYLKFK